jgi:hypothetical protein
VKVDGEVEAVSREGELGAPGGHVWIKLKENSQTYLAPITVAATIRKGQQVVLQCVESHLGLKVQSVAAPAKTEGYEALLERCQNIVAQTRRSALDYIKANWELGKELVNIPREQGEATVKRLAADLAVSYGQLYHCMKFAEKFPEFKAVERQFVPSVQNLTWRGLRASLYEKRQVAKGKESTGEPKQLPSNPAATAEELVEAYRPERKPLPRSESKPALQMRHILNILHIDHVTEEPIPVEGARGPITYIADFLIGTLIVEVDSSLHDPDSDQERDEALRKANYAVLRFPDSQVAAAYDLIIQLETTVHGKPLEALV